MLLTIVRFNCLCGLAFAACFMSDSRAADRDDYYSTSSQPGGIFFDWMKDVQDGKTLTQFSIPGTHDSCALHGGDAVRCQTMSITSQLNAGIRFLDIRCRRSGSDFAIHHGVVYQKIGFGAVQKQCIEFLKKYPTECIVMSIKEEHKAARVSASFSSIFDDYKKGNEEYWYTEDRVPKLGEVRGKIVLMQRASNIGGFGLTKFNVEDHYSVPTVFAIKKKWNYVKANVTAARNSTAEKGYLTYTNGVSSGAYPYTVARSVNKSLYKHLSSCGNMGIVVMDFPGSRLIQGVINARN